MNLRALAVAFLLLPASAFAISTIVVDTSSSNLPTAYTTAATSLKLSGLPVSPERHFMLTNETAGRICCHVVPGSVSSAPSSSDGTELCAPASTIKAWDVIPVHRGVFCRSGTGSTISSGTFMLEVW